MAKPVAKTYDLTELSFGEVVIERLGDLGVTPHDLENCGLVSIPSSSVYRWGNGTRKPGEKMRAIFVALGLTKVVAEGQPEWIGELDRAYAEHQKAEDLELSNRIADARREKAESFRRLSSGKR